MKHDKLLALKALGLSDDAIEKLLADVLATEKQALADGVRYKEAKMSKNADYDALDAGYDVLNRVKDAHGMPAAVAVARAMVRTGADLESGRAVLKEGKATYKELHHGPALGLLEQATKEMGEDGVVAVLKSAIAQFRASKKAAADPWQNPDFANMAPR